MQHAQLFWLMALLVVAAAVLAGLGKLPAAQFEAVAAGILGWLAPSPVLKDISK